MTKNETATWKQGLSGTVFRGNEIISARYVNELEHQARRVPGLVKALEPSVPGYADTKALSVIAQELIDNISDFPKAMHSDVMTADELAIAGVARDAMGALTFLQYALEIKEKIARAALIDAETTDAN